MGCRSLCLFSPPFTPIRPNLSSVSQRAFSHFLPSSSRAPIHHSAPSGSLISAKWCLSPPQQFGRFHRGTQSQTCDMRCPPQCITRRVAPISPLPQGPFVCDSTERRPAIPTVLLLREIRFPYMATLPPPPQPDRCAQTRPSPFNPPEPPVGRPTSHPMQARHAVTGDPHELRVSSYHHHRSTTV